MNFTVCDSRRFTIGDSITFDLSPRWWPNPIRWLRSKLFPRKPLVVTAVDYETGVITVDSVE